MNPDDMRPSLTQPFVLPVRADAATEAFFAATGAGLFPLYRCRTCGRVNGPNELCCSRCRAVDLEQVPAAGGGHVVAATVEHSKPAADGSTYRLVAVIVQLDEGPWWWTQLAGVDPVAVRSGDRIRIEMVTPEGGRTVPIARPAVENDVPGAFARRVVTGASFSTDEGTAR